MKKYLFLGLCVALLATCSDGDLQIGIIDFDDVPVQFCDVLDPQASNVLFKINDDETLFLQLQSGVLNRGVAGDTITTESTIPGQSQLTYRVLSDAVSEAYFCDAIPPAGPSLIEEIKAEKGLVIIETFADEGTTNFIHTLRLSDISFINEDGERLTDLTLGEFGELTTAIDTD